MRAEPTFQRGAAGRAGGQPTHKQMAHGASKVGGLGRVGSLPWIRPAGRASVTGCEGSEAVSAEGHFWRKQQQVPRP